MSSCSNCSKTSSLCAAAAEHSLFGKPLDDARRVLRALDKQIEPHVFVRRVRARARMPHARVADGHMQVMQERMIRPAAADDGRDEHLFLIHLARRIGHDLDERVIRVGAPGLFTADKLDAHIAEPLCVEMPTQLGDNILRVLIGHQAKVNFGAGKTVFEPGP